MKQIIMAGAICLFLAGCGTKVEYFSLANALNDNKAKEALGSDIEFSFGGGEKQGAFITTSKRTTITGKGGVENACRWVLYSAIKQLQQQARKEGNKKIVNIMGNWKHKPYDSKDKFQCAVGNMLAGVALRGTLE